MRKLTDYNVGFLQGISDAFRTNARVTIFCNDNMWTADPNNPGMWYCKYL